MSFERVFIPCPAHEIHDCPDLPPLAHPDGTASCLSMANVHNYFGIEPVVVVRRCQPARDGCVAAKTADPED